MKLLSALLSRALDVVDAAFDALRALSRVALRGAFTPDAKSYRSSRYARLEPAQVLIQEIALNAGDAGEARKAVALDPERALPLATDEIVFDVVGPIADDARPRARPERTFVLGVARKEALARAREESARKGAIEAFVFTPPQHPELALTFGDEAGARRRRLRRALLALALALLAVTLSDTARAFDEALGRRLAAADADRLALERRIRLAERGTAEGEAARAALLQASGPSLGEASARLMRLAVNLPAETELMGATLETRSLSLTGRSYAPDAAELALRRAFEGETISFAPGDGEAPQSFSVRLSERLGDAP